MRTEPPENVDSTNLSAQGLAEMPKIPLFSPNTTRIIEMLAFPRVQLLDVTGPLQVFASANEFVAQSGGTPPYALQVVAPGGGFGVITSAGVGLAAGPLPDTSAALDTLMVGGGPGVDAAAADPTL